MVMQPAADFQVGDSIPWSRLVSAAAAVGGLGSGPPTHTAAVECFTTRPLRVLQ